MSDALALGITAISAYFLGSFPAGLIAGKIAGIDIRTKGSGNIGATNVVRVLGKRFGYAVFIVDFCKGCAAVLVSWFIATHFKSNLAEEIFAITAGVCAVLGHSFPVWLGFKGGKGVATTMGVVFSIMPLAAAIIVLVWALTFGMTRYVSVASIAAAVTLPISVLLLPHRDRSGIPLLFYFALSLATVVILRHRGNIARLANGTEPRFRRK